MVPAKINVISVKWRSQSVIAMASCPLCDSTCESPVLGLFSIEGNIVSGIAEESIIEACQWVP